MRRTRSSPALLLAAGLLALSGCGGTTATQAEPAENDTTTREPAVFPLDTTFTMKQLEAALPTTAQVPDSRKVVVRCPPGATKAGCIPAARGETITEVILSTDHRDQKTTEDHSKPGYWRPELYDVVAKRYVDQPTAQQAWQRQLAGVEAVDGKVDTPAQKQETGEAWGSRGSGTVGHDDVRGLDGLQVDAVLRDVDTAGKVSKPLQVAIVGATWGRHVVTVKVVFFAGHHQSKEALDRADTVIRQYLGRLRKSA